MPETSAETIGDYPIDLASTTPGRSVDRSFFRAARAIRSSALTTHQRAVLVLSLLLRSSPDGLAWPAIETIAGDVGASRRTVLYVLQELEALGVIVRRPSSHRSQAYQVRIARILEITPAQVEEARDAVRKIGARDVQEEAEEEAEAPEAPKRARMADAVALVWEAHRERHARAGKAPPSGDRRLIEARIRDVKATDGADELQAAAEVSEVLRAYAKSPDAAFYQGANDRGRSYLGIETLLKAEGWTTRLEFARAWREAGRPEAAQRVVPGGEDAAAKAWAYLGELLRIGARALPGDLERKVGKAKAAALLAGLDAIGGFTSFGRLRQAEERDARASFVSAFVAELARGA